MGAQPSEPSYNFKSQSSTSRGVAKTAAVSKFGKQLDAAVEKGNMKEARKEEIVEAIEAIAKGDVRSEA